MKKIVVLTGAGMSADSGLKTFRDSGGLWEGFDIREVATVEGWQEDPEKVLQFYNKRRKQAFEAEPHAGHKALANLEEHFDVSIITQNVDNLHERAGSRDVLHLHGELTKVRSEKNSSLVYDIGDKSIKLGDRAEDDSQLRPHVVWFGERVPSMEKATKIVPQADILVTIGTSLVVYPAAGLVDYVSTQTPKYLVDPAEPEIADTSNWNHIQKPAAQGVPEMAEQLKSKYI